MSPEIFDIGTPWRSAKVIHDAEMSRARMRQLLISRVRDDGYGHNEDSHT
ncbi:MAG: hypothetical protein RIK87_21145 [Fuerstiella sp.]